MCFDGPGVGTTADLLAMKVHRFLFLCLLVSILFLGTVTFAQDSASSAPAASGASAVASSGTVSKVNRTPRPRKAAESDGDPLKGHRLVCLFNSGNYMRSNFSPSMVDPTICTHLNYEFAVLDPVSYIMKAGNPKLDIGEKFYEQAVNLKKKNANLTVLLSVGGWEDSTKKYSELVESPSRIDNFVTEAVSFLKSHGFDGLDVSWQYPNCWQGAIGISPKDKNNYSTFLKKLRETFDTENMTLSISVAAVKREINAAYDVAVISGFVDHINVMSYDMHGPWEGRTGHHAQFFGKQGDIEPTMNMVTSLEIWTNLGANKSKINAGIPSYALTFTLENIENHQPGAASKGPGKPGPMSKQGGYLCYSELCQMLNEGKWTEAQDSPYGDYCFSGDQWASYDPPTMGVKKVEWIMANGYGGVMLKDCSCDDWKGICASMPNPITKLVYLEMKHKAKKMQSIK